MALAFRTVARGLPAAGMVEDQGTREEVIRDRELPEEFKLALTQTRGERTFGAIFILYIYLHKKRTNANRLREIGTRMQRKLL
jgi:hypothetical protein